MAQGVEIDPSIDRVFITKIPQTATKEDILSHFSRFGATTDVYLPSTPGWPGHKGIAFVSFADPFALQLVMTHSPHEIKGQEVVVDVAAPRGTIPPVSRGQVEAQQEIALTGSHLPTSHRLFVTKIPPAIQREHIREYFSQFGEPTDVYMPSIPGGSTHKGICFVSFADWTSLQLALQYSPHEIQGHQVVVDLATPRAQARGSMLPGVLNTMAPFAPATFAPSPAAATGMVPTLFPNASLGVNMGSVGNIVPERQIGSTVGTALAGTSSTGVGISGAAAGNALAIPGLGGMLGGTGLGGPLGCGACGGVAGFGTGAAPMLAGMVPHPTCIGTPVPGRLFVLRVAPDMTKVDLQLYFQQYGQLDDVFIPNGGKGIAFVSYNDPAVAQRVMTQQQHFVKPGQAVLVEQAMDRPPMGGKGKGGMLARQAFGNRSAPY